MHGHDADFIAGNFHVALPLKVGRAQPRHKTLQRGGRFALIAQRKLEKFVERVVGFMAEPPKDSLPAAVAAEQPGIERKRRFGFVTALTDFKTLHGMPEFAAGRRVTVQRLAQRSLARPRQIEQIVVGKPEQRAFERDRERQIVLRQQ